MARRVPRHQYAPAREIWAYALHRARAGVQAASLLVLGGGLLGGGSGLADAYDAGRLAHSMKAQADLYRHRYDEARTHLPPAPMEVPALQLAVETAESLRDARKTPDALLLALSRCLDLQPAVRLESIDWSAEAGSFPARQPAEPASLAPESGTRHGASGSAHGPVLTVDFQGRIEPFDGDYRRALEEVDVLADSLRAVSGVFEVEVLSLPLDIGSGSSLRGDAGARSGTAEAPFALRILWDPYARS